jgi:hypothetical protein
MIVGVGEGDGEAVGVGVAEAVGVGVAEAVGVGDAELVGVGFFMLTPLFQTNFLPDLTQVYLIPDLMLV